ncbi:MAG: hypothetical protein DRN83_03225 [Hadesarchaea archaeon]|nr:MAG: hypothetical protein DRN83_03225 [Hadesarchaea archaeon]
MFDDVLFAILLILLFWNVVGLINRWHKLEKHGITVSPGMLIWRTKRGLGFIDRVARAYRRGWVTFGTVAAVMGFVFMLVILFMFGQSAAFIIQEPESAPPGAMIPIPGVTIPLFYGLVSLFSVLIVHEFAHGFVMRAQGIRTKSTGVLLFVVLPGAFVEQDEKQLKNAPISKRLRVYGAGPFANILFAFACLGLLLVSISPNPGVYVYDTVESYQLADNTVVPGASWGILRPGDRLLELSHLVDNVAVDRVVIEGYENFSEFMENTKEGDNVVVLVERNGQEENFLITLTQYPENENRGMMGVLLTYAHSGFLYYVFNPLFDIMGPKTYAINPYTYDAHVPWSAVDLLRWLIFLHFAVGLFNLLPMKPLDGGYLISGAVERVSSRQRAAAVSNAISFVVLLLLLVNFMPVFI